MSSRSIPVLHPENRQKQENTTSASARQHANIYYTTVYLCVVHSHTNNNFGIIIGLHIIAFPHTQGVLRRAEQHDKTYRLREQPAKKQSSLQNQ